MSLTLVGILPGAAVNRAVTVSGSELDLNPSSKHPRTGDPADIPSDWFGVLQELFLWKSRKSASEEKRGGVGDHEVVHVRRSKIDI